MRTVTSHLACRVSEPARICLQIEVSREMEILSESLHITLDDQPIDVETIEDHLGNRLLVVEPDVGRLQVDYRAEVASAASTAGGHQQAQAWEYVRPSRYAESDEFAAVANDLFADLSGAALVQAVGDWVHRHLVYVPGISKVTESAKDTYLARQGICRDFAHLTCAFLRARNVPARFVSVYAPGLSPMDFHAVAEAFVDGHWTIVDATRLAPRRSLVRIATGRDAADTAFMTVTAGRVDLQELSVTAVVDDQLPEDDHVGVMRMA